LKAFHIAYCTTCCYIKVFGRYKQGKQLNNLVVEKENLARKPYYLRMLFKNCALPVEEKKREIYTEKTISTKAIIATTTLFRTLITNKILKNTIIALLQLSKDQTQGYLR
jgi:hypothetical protein